MNARRNDTQGTRIVPPAAHLFEDGPRIRGCICVSLDIWIRRGCRDAGSQARTISLGRVDGAHDDSDTVAVRTHANESRSSSDGRQKTSQLCLGTNSTPTGSRPITRRHHQGRGCGSLRTSTGTRRSGRPGSRSTLRRTPPVGGGASGRTERTQSGAAQTISSRPSQTSDQTRSRTDRRSSLRPIIPPPGTRRRLTLPAESATSLERNHAPEDPQVL